MNVKELIEKLKKMPQEALVYYEDDVWGHCIIDEVKIDVDGDIRLG